MFMITHGVSVALMMSTMKSKQILTHLFLLFCLASCAMERIPAAVQVTNTSTSQFEFSLCQWKSFPETTTSLLPNIRLIDCVVKNDLAPETVEFEFTQKGGQLFGKQSGNLIETIELETNDQGVLYYLNYAPDRGVQDSLGRWCCWNTNSEVPEMSALLPDELHAIHIESDGGIVYRASWNINKNPRGLVIILCGLGGMQHSSKTLGHGLLQDGWAVVYLYTVLNVPKYRMNIELDSQNPSADMIKLFDTKYCQVIAATKAIHTRMEKQLPSLQNTSLALIGISAGAINTPAVYYEMRDEVDAIILIAGGANMFDIVQEGAFTNWKFTNADGKKFSTDELRVMNELYLNTPSRDPYHLAPILPRDTTLIIHAKWDAVVPASNGDLLWERAGRPERWVYPSGHLGLFMTFDWHTHDIVQWLDSKME